MELRKCCNHPFLLKGVEQREEARAAASGRAWAACDGDRLVDAGAEINRWVRHA